MTKQAFLEYCSGICCTSLDYPFDEEFETAVLRYGDNRKWYALVMWISWHKFGFDSDEMIDVITVSENANTDGDFYSDVLRYDVEFTFVLCGTLCLAVGA